MCIWAHVHLGGSKWGSGGKSRRIRNIGSKREGALLSSIVRDGSFDKGDLTRYLKEMRE